MKNLEGKNETYIARYNTALDCMKDNIDWLVKDEIKRQDKMLKHEYIKSFWDEHIVLFSIITFSLSVGFIFIMLSGTIILNHNLELDMINKKSLICKETGYGCTSNTVNTDIKYDNTPIIEVEK